MLPLVVHLFGRQQTNHAEGPDRIRGEGGDGSWFTVKECFFDGIQPREGIVLCETRIRQRDGYGKSQPVVFLVPPDKIPGPWFSILRAQGQERGGATLSRPIQRRLVRRHRAPRHGATRGPRHTR